MKDATTTQAIVRRLMKAMAAAAERDRLMSNRYVGYCTDHPLDIEAQSKCVRGVVRVRWYSARGDASSKAEIEKWLIMSAEDREVTDVCGDVVMQRNGYKVRQYEERAEWLESVADRAMGGE